MMKMAESQGRRVWVPELLPKEDPLSIMKTHFELNVCGKQMSSVITHFWLSL